MVQTKNQTKPKHPCQRIFLILGEAIGDKEIKPVIHIGFLNYTLFEECPEFYATYKLINVKSHHVYSDNLTLGVVDLTKIGLAAEEDR